MLKSALALVLVLIILVVILTINHVPIIILRPWSMWEMAIGEVITTMKVGAEATIEGILVEEVIAKVCLTTSPLKMPVILRHPRAPLAGMTQDKTMQVEFRWVQIRCPLFYLSSSTIPSPFKIKEYHHDFWHS
jgi:hypothetical protein